MEIIGEIKGGLGNQLFQYATTKELAAAYGCPASFDCATVAGGDAIGRTLLLNRLFPDENYALTRTVLVPPRDAVVAEQPNDTLELLRQRVDAAVAQGAERIFLSGYFQHERFMPNAGPAVKRHLRALSAAHRAQIAADGREGVAVHLRRHDYAHFGICADNYIVAALNWLKRKLEGKLKIFVFSDEPLYTQSLLVKHGIGDAVQVQPGDTLADFFWLCSFKHYVLSNSTFSWWGGYVGEEADSLIFAPKSPWVIPDPALNPASDRWIGVDAVVNATLTLEQADRKILEARFWERARSYMATNRGRFAIDYSQLFPCLEDEFPSHGFEPHYTYHTAWAARKLRQYGIREHHDFGGCLRFVTIASAFVDKLVYHEYRAVDLRLSGLECRSANLLKLAIPDASLASVSCMHVVEHIGLGRYGDPIDPDGDIVATRELARVLAHGGTLLFVVPMGRERIQFNAHRIYAYDSVLKLFPGLELLEFSLITDQAVWIGITENADPSLVANQNHACGCFVFRKP